MIGKCWALARVLLLGLLAFSAVMIVHPAAAKEKNDSEIADILSDREMNKSQRFVINNSLFTLYHEVGHLLVDQLGWPVLSREEDVADNFATYHMLNQARRSFETALKDSALGWRLENEAYGGRIHVSDYYDEHSLDLQRAYQIVCLMVGKDRATFYDLAREWDIDRVRQSRCRNDYEQVARGFAEVIDRAGNKSREVKVNVVYGVAGSQYDQAYKTLRESRMLESVAEELRRGYGLTRPVTLRADLCGEPNAFYDNNNIEIIMCYELLDDYFDMIGDYMAAGNSLR